MDLPESDCTELTRITMDVVPTPFLRLLLASAQTNVDIKIEENLRSGLIISAFDLIS